MENPATPPRRPAAPAPRPRWNSPATWGLMLLALALVLIYVLNAPSSRSSVSYDFFRKQLDWGNVERVRIVGQDVEGTFRVAPPAPPQSDDSDGGRSRTPKKIGKQFTTVLPPIVGEDLERVLLEKGVRIEAQRPSDSTALLLLTYLGVT